MGFEGNKIFGAILLAMLVAALSGFVARELMEPEIPEKPAYIVEGTAPAQAVTAAVTAAPDPIEALLAGADAAAGQKLSRVCVTCHSFEKDGANKVGPNLWGIVGNVHAHKEDFGGYSEAMKSMHDKTWDYEELNHFLFSPRGYIKGTKMAFAGVTNTKDRANLIAWLRTLADNPAPLPAAPAGQ
ncbi:MAG: cytochrome c family protein [Alphaproteobacteria bacterium]